MENETITKPARPKLYGPLLTVGITLAIYLGAQLLGSVLISLIPGFLHWTPQQSSDWLTNNTGAQFLFIAIVEALTLFALRKFLKARQANFKNLGLNRPRLIYIAHALSGFAIYFVMYIAGLVIASKLVPGLNIEQKQELGFSTATHGSGLWLIFLSLVILPPITEEIVVRGFLYGGLSTKLTPSSAAIIASLLFAAAHLAEGGKGGLLWVAAIDTFILSMVLCYLREKTGSLWPSIGVHLLKNGLAFVLLFNIVQYFR